MPTRKKSESDHYFANGERVELHPSTAFTAVRTAGDGAAAAAAAADTGTGPAADPGVIVLPDRGLVLVPTSSGAAAGVQRALRATDDTAGQAPVYESESATGVYLVPNGEVIVKFTAATSAAVAEAAVAEQGGTIARTDYPEPGAYLVAVASEADAVPVANALHAIDAVEYAEPNFVQIAPRPAMDVLAPAEINLPRSEPQLMGQRVSGSAAPDPSIGTQWGLAKIRAFEAWGISSGDPAISVAVLDEGVDMSHEDLSLRLPGFDAYDGDNNPQPDGNDAHGTACAGIVSALRDNGRGGAGVAPGCRVMPVRIAKGVGGGFWDTDSAKVANAIRTSVDRGADVLSNSYSVGASTAVTNAFTYAATTGRGGRGCAMAAASGNSEGTGIIYPARLSPTIPGMLAVGASNEWDQRKSTTSLDGETWWGSTYGPELDVVAPGVHIFTTDIMGGAGYSAGNYTPGFNGTSSATPHAAGVMALVLSVDRDLRGWEVEDIIKMTTADLGVAGRDDFTGWGRVDARRALEAASKLWYDITPTVEFVGGRAFMRINARLYNSGINTLRLDSFTLTSHTDDGSGEVDRFEYRPNPGAVMLPRSGQDVRLNRVLLKANGNRRSWSYRWSAQWTYTFWRPSTPGFPLSATGVSLDEAMAGQSSTGSGSARSDADSRTTGESGPTGSALSSGVSTAQANGGHTMSLDDDTEDMGMTDGRRTITITIT